ncbi:hypothetical protein T484DRAFT_2145656 [Baffinella frigidus]|nr:hypothetical protein T484DRAFT_2145656 [Cryptophyta sp. CCMP2293]
MMSAYPPRPGSRPGSAMDQDDPEPINLSMSSRSMPGSVRSFASGGAGPPGRNPVAAHQTGAARLGEAKRQEGKSRLVRSLYGDLSSSRSEGARSDVQGRRAWDDGPSDDGRAQNNASQLARVRGAHAPPVQELDVDGLPHMAAAPSPGSDSRYEVSGGEEGPPSSQRSPTMQAAAIQQANRDFLTACEDFVREYNHRGRIALARGDIPAAHKNLLEAQKLVEGDLAGHRALTALTYNNLGCLLRRVGHPQKALRVLQKALATLAEHPEAAAMRRKGPAPTGGGSDEVDIDVADVHLNVSSALSQLKRHSDALNHVETAIAILSERLGGSERLRAMAADRGQKREARTLKNLRLLTIAYYNCAAEQQVLGLVGEAVSTFQRALHVCEAHLGREDPLFASIQAAHAASVQAAARLPAAGGRNTTGDVTNMTAAPPGVTPLRLSMLHQRTLNSSAQSGKLLSTGGTSVRGAGGEERPSHRS